MSPLLRLPARLARVQYLRKSPCGSKPPEQTRQALSIGQRRSPIGTADEGTGKSAKHEVTKQRSRKAAPRPMTTAARVAVNLEVAARKSPSDYLVAGQSTHSPEIH